MKKTNRYPNGPFAGFKGKSITGYWARRDGKRDGKVHPTGEVGSQVASGGDLK